MFGTVSGRELPGMTGEQLKAIRCQLDLTVDQAAAIAGVRVRTWQRYEAGTKEIPEGVADRFRTPSDESGGGKNGK